MTPFAQLARWLAVLGLVACGSCRCDPDPVTTDAGAGLVAPAPAPAGLVAEIVSARPEEAWQKLRIALGGSAFFLPKSLGALLSTLVGLPISAAPEIDGTSPLWGALAFDPEGGVLRGVIGVHVLAGERLASQLTIGDNPPYRARVDATSGVTILEPTSAEPKAPAALGVARDYLLIGRTPEDLVHLGPYVARTLPGREVPTGDLVVETRAEMGAPTEIFAVALERAAGLVALPGVAPDLLLPEGFVDLRSLLADLDRVRATWVIDEHAGRLRIASSPKGGEGPAKRLASELVPRTAQPHTLLDLPADTIAVWGQRQSPPARAASAGAAAAWVDGLAGPALAEPDRRELVDLLEAIAGARGESFTVGVRAGELGPAVFARTSLTDGAAAEAGLTRLWRWLERPAVVERLRGASLAAEVGETRVERLPGEVQRLRLRLVDPAKRPPGTESLPESIDLLFLPRRDPDELWIAAGYDSPEALRSVAVEPERTLGDAPAVRALVEAVADRAAIVGYLDLTGLRSLRGGRQPRGEPAPLVLTVSAEGAAADIAVEVAVARPALPDLLRLVRVL